MQSYMEDTKTVLILLSTLLVSILGVRQFINEYGNPKRIALTALGVIDENDRDLQVKKVSSFSYYSC